MISASLFKAYDIRGIVDKTLTVDAVYAIGQAIATLARQGGDTQVVIGRDGRLSGTTLAQALTQGLQAGGLSVIDLGQVTTPMVYFAVHELGTGTGVMVTGSHNPPEYNGLKMVIGGEAIYGDTIQQLRALAQSLAAHPAFTPPYRTDDIAARYQQRIVDDIRLARPMKVAVDCGNGVAGAYAPALLRALGCEVTELFCEVDGHFPNHHPDPAHPENLQDLMHCLREGDAEIGLAFDGDGDRLGVVTQDGQIIFPDRQMMLFARDVLAQQPGSTIIYDVKCSRLLGTVIREAGGTPLMWRTGHSLVKAKLKETGAPLAGEMSGHIFFKQRWYGFDDGLYAAARLLEIVSRTSNPSALLNSLPNASATPELHLALAEGENHALIERLQREGQFPDAQDLITLDGVRAEYADGFGLARASNTTPVVVLRFEGDNAQALARIQADFAREIRRLKPQAVLPF